VVWNDNRTGTDLNLYAQQIDSLGGILWAADGVPIADTVQSQQNHILISDGSGGLLTVWQDGRNGQSDIYGQLINANLTVTSPIADTVWGGGIAHMVSWSYRVQDVAFDHLDISLSIADGDGFPVTVADNLSPSALSTSWTPAGNSSSTSLLLFEAKDSRDALIASFTGPAFTLDSDPPESFNLIEPVQSAVTDLMPVFEWEATTDGLSGLKAYELWIDGVRFADSLDNISYTVQESEKLSEGSHTWQVLAVDSAGQIQSSEIMNPLLLNIYFIWMDRLLSTAFPPIRRRLSLFR